MAMWHLGDQPLADWAAAMQAGHIRLGPSLINKDYALRINLALKAPPMRATPRDVRTVLLGCAQGFFYS